MKEPRHDDERLAELLDRRLEGPERDELLAHLADADEDFHVFARTAAVLRELEEEESSRTQPVQEVNQPPARETPPPSLRPGWHRWKAPRVLASAILVGLVAAGTFMIFRGSSSAGNPVHLAAVLGADTRVSEAWITDRPGIEMRGAGERAPAEAGALLVDLAVSIQAEDVQTTRLLARQIHESFDDRAVPGSPIRQIIDRAGEPASVLLPLVEQQTERLSDGSDRDRDYLQLGAWTEAALLAADREDADFFRSGTTRTMLRRAVRITRDNPAAQQALRAVQATLETGGTRDWPTLQGQLRSLMGAIAS